MLNALSFDIEDWFHMVEIDAVADKPFKAECSQPPVADERREPSQQPAFVLIQPPKKSCHETPRRTLPAAKKKGAVVAPNARDTPKEPAD